MAYVITQPCCNDATCIDVCPVDCIRPLPGDPDFGSAEMLYIEPTTCIDCGACAEVCPVEAIFPEEELSDGQVRYASINADYFATNPLGSGAEGSKSRSGRLPKVDPPLRVAIVGSGPAACYSADELIRAGRQSVEVEMFERLPTPWGLIRAGVAPDHPGTKVVTDSFRSVMSKPSFRLHLNVEIGRHLSHEDLMAHHDAVLYAVGASSDRQLEIPGEDLDGSCSATDFVAWYNGHPDYADREFDLSSERVVIVGNGNVALDVARVLVTHPDELAGTDIADHALAALRTSRVREVVVVGRRGPAQAAYTGPELLALGQLAGVDVIVDARELAVAAGDASNDLKTQVAVEYSLREPEPRNRRIVLRFCASPTEIFGDGRVRGLTLVRNQLVEGADGTVYARATGDIEVLEAGLVLRSIGYVGLPVPGLPFDTDRCTLPHIGGRVVDPQTGMPMQGVYTAGWIKRGASGVIGTNKWCAKETVAALLEDAVGDRLSRPTLGRAELSALVRLRQPDVIDSSGWEAVDRAERQRGKEHGRPRIKFTDVGAMIAVARGDDFPQP